MSHTNTGSWRVRALGLATALGLILGAALFVRAETLSLVPETRLLQMFVDAGRAYDEGELDTATSLYEDLINQGYEDKELFYNLGNTLFRRGLVGPAVLAYRRAWYQSPRDPDVRANLRFALQSTGAADPSPSRLTRLWAALNRTEWATVATTAYWLLFASAGVLLLRPGLRPWSAHLLAPLLIVLVIALSGIGYWWTLHHRPEVVVLADQQEVLFAPLEGSTAHFALPQGSIVRRVDRSGPWIKISLGKQTGWIKDSACQAVWPSRPEGT